MQITLISNSKIENLEKLLIKYASNPEDPGINFYLGVSYESIGHTAPALSYYLRCSERTENQLLAYEALIRGAYCYQKQGGRDWTAKTLFQHALLTQPTRPEAYFLLSRFCRERNQNQDAYIYASQGLMYVDNEFDSLITDVDYHGKIGLLFEKAVSGWFWGKVDESVNTLNDLYRSPNTPQVYKEESKRRLKEFKKWKGLSFGDRFDWGDLPYEDIITITREILDEEVYNFWREVQKGDVVVDIGASVGAFTYSILNKNPSKVYCIEPSATALGCLLKNTSKYILGKKENPIVCINKAIGDSKDNVNIFGNDSQFDISKFSDIIRDYQIDKIDFLKIDCEGGEYSIFSESNLDYLLNNVEFIAAEFHLKSNNCREKFKKFRDSILTKFKNYSVKSCTHQTISSGNVVDLKDNIFDDEFIDTYNSKFMIYISNKKED